MRTQIGLIGSRQGQVACCCEYGTEHVLHKMWKISRLAEELCEC